MFVKVLELAKGYIAMLIIRRECPWPVEASPPPPQQSGKESIRSVSSSVGEEILPVRYVYMYLLPEPILVWGLGLSSDEETPRATSHESTGWLQEPVDVN